MNYLPTKQDELKAFALNFAARIVAAPDKHALVAADATVIDEAAQAYATSLDLAQAPLTRTAASIVAKNNAREALLPILRGYAMMIKTNRAVSDEDKTNLGLRMAGSNSALLAAPASQPIVNLVDMTATRHVLRFADVLTPDSRAKPAGVEGLQLFCYIGTAATPPTDPLAGRFRALITRYTASIDFDLTDAGKVAYYFARWQGAKGLFGPWSDMLRVGIAG